MQKFLVLLFFFPAITNLQAQILPNFDGFKLEKASDYKIAEPIVLQAANYLLATAYDKDNSGQKDALKNVIPVSYTHLDVYKRQAEGEPPQAVPLCRPSM